MSFLSSSKFGTAAISAGLPTELFERFIDCLADFKSDLRASSLVSRAWLPRSRALLFHSLSTNDRFLQDLQNVQLSIHLAPLVRVLKVDLNHSPEAAILMLNSLAGFEQLSCLWLFRSDFTALNIDESLPHLSISSLKSLVLENASFKDAYQALCFLSSSCFSRIVALRLDAVHHRPSTDLPSILNLWAQSTSLRGPIRTISLTEIEVRRLSVDRCELFDLLYHPDSPFDWTCLSRIRVSRLLHNEVMRSVVRRPLPALTHLEIEDDWMISDIAATLKYTSIFSCLKEISLKSPRFEFSARLLREIASCIEEYEEAHPPILEYVNVVLPSELSQWFLAPAHISPVRDAVSRIARSPSVREVRLVLHLSKSMDERIRASIGAQCYDHLNLAEEGVVILVEEVNEGVSEPFTRIQ